MQRRSLLLAAGAATVAPFIGRSARAQGAAAVLGAGSSLPNPVFKKWGEVAAAEAKLQLTYELIGASPAIEQLKARKVDFAAIDYPRRPALLRENHLIQFPTILVGAVPFVNLPGVADGQLRLTGELLADIFLGKITRWNDAKIKALNGGLAVPDLPVVPVHRTESSGTTMLYTTFFTRASEAWAAGPRAGTLVEWPAGVGEAVEGSSALMAKVKSTPGALGFAGTTAIKANQLASVSLRNQAKEFVKADVASFNKAAAAADWSAPGFNLDLIDVDAAGAWPILGSSFVLVADNPPPEKVEAVRNVFRFFDWAFKKGMHAASELDCPGIPESVVAKVAEAWRHAKDPSGRPVWEA